MADRLPPVLEGGFSDRQSFEEWLQSIPEDSIKSVVRVLSLRNALRLLPITFSDINNLANPEQSRQLAIVLFRAILVSLAVTRSRSIETAYEPARVAKAVAQSGVTSLTDSPAASAIRFAANSKVDFTQLSKPILDRVIRDHIWAAVTEDARALVLGPTPVALSLSPLWLDGDPPDWWVLATSGFGLELADLDYPSNARDAPSSNWMIWDEWYINVANGRPPWSLPYETAWELEERIALSDERSDNFWERDPEEINREILRWVTEARIEEDIFKEDEDTQTVFISYTASDLETTKRIGTIIEEAGAIVFAQYKDMPPGSNFVAEMNEGLGGMNRFVPIYSPDYIVSDICQAEWNTAYYKDPLGRKRLIVGFMIKPCTVLPLMKQTVYVPLYNLSEAKSREAIIDALTWDGTPFNATKSRKIAADYATPLPIITAAGIIGIEDTTLEAPFIDDELATLPESMRKALDRIIASLKAANCSPMLLNSLQDYKSELMTKGASPNLADLNRCDGIIRAELKDAEEYQPGWYGSGMKTAFSHIFEMHEKMRQHFPLMMLRDFSIERTSTNPEKFDDAALGSAHRNFAARAEDAFEVGQVTEEFHATMELRERQRRDIESLRTKPQPPQEDMFLSPDDRATPQEIKKRWLFDQSGTLDKLVFRAAQASTVSDSETVKALVKAAKNFLDSLWS